MGRWKRSRRSARQSLRLHPPLPLPTDNTQVSFVPIRLSRTPLRNKKEKQTSLKKRQGPAKQPYRIQQLVAKTQTSLSRSYARLRRRPRPSHQQPWNVLLRKSNRRTRVVRQSRNPNHQSINLPHPPQRARLAPTRGATRQQEQMKARACGGNARTKTKRGRLPRERLPTCLSACFPLLGRDSTTGTLPPLPTRQQEREKTQTPTHRHTHTHPRAGITKKTQDTNETQPSTHPFQEVATAALYPCFRGAPPNPLRISFTVLEWRTGRKDCGNRRC